MKNAPLTKKERDFAEENHGIVLWYLKKCGLNPDEWYDVVIFRYMLSVQHWFARPSLHRHKFSTIACRAMSSAIYNERKKQKIRIPTISLDEIIPGTEGMTYGDTVTYQNLDYKGVYDMQISYNVLLPERKAIQRGKSDEVIALEAFLGMDKKKSKNMRFEYETVDEAKRRLSTFRSYLRKNNYLDQVELFRNENCLYIVRKEEKK